MKLKQILMLGSILLATATTKAENEVVISNQIIENRTFNHTSTYNADADLLIQGSDIVIRNCEFIGNREGLALWINESSSGNITIENCTFDYYMAGLRIDKRVDVKPVLRNNTFIRCKYPIWAESSARLNLGDEKDLGNNSFINSRRNHLFLVYGGVPIESRGNYWTEIGTENPLTKEEDVLNSIYIAQPQARGLKLEERLIHVLPILTQDPNLKPASIKSWMYY